MDPARILLVDDETALLALLKRFLERNGHTVVAVASSEAALDALAAAPDWIPEVLIADETLPGESGTALAKVLMARFPELRSLLCSGHLLSLEALPGELRPRAAVLQKPYLPPMLQQAITGLLSAPKLPQSP